MLGTEAIWWLNSVLLAALTHVGLFWMLIVAEPERKPPPVETKIVIETLPVAESEPTTPKVQEVEIVDDSVRPDKIRKSENIVSVVPTEAEETPDVVKTERALKTERDDGRLATASDREATDITRVDDRLETTSNTEEKLSSANKVQTIPQAIDSLRDKTTVKPIASKPSQSKTVEKRTRIESAKTPRTVTDEKTVLKSAVNAPASLTPSANGKDEKTKIAAERPAIAELENSENITVSNNRTEASKPVGQSSDEMPTVSSNDFDFPSDAKRLAPTSTKPSKPVPARRVAAINSERQRSETSSSQTPRSEKLPQVAVVNPGRAKRVAPDNRYRDLLKFLEQGEIRGCATVLPTVARDGSVSLSGFAADENLWTDFQDSMNERLRVQLPLAASTVAKPQCRALTFARTQPLYPRFSLDMKLDKTEMISGEELKGVINDVRDRKLHLVVVDDEGLVQQIDAFLQPKVGSFSFAVPLSVSGQAVRTAQMLLAIAVDKNLASVRSANATSADEFFAAISEELAETGQEADVAIVSFYLRSAEAE